MKAHLLLAGAAALALLTIPPKAAQADLPVIDVTSVGNLLKSIGIEGEQLTQLEQTYQQVVQVYGMANNIWNAVQEVVGADQWAAGLRDPSIRNPLPFGAANHPGWVGGYNDPAGLPFGSQYMTQNTVGGDPSVYQNGSFVGTELLKATQALSSMQAVSSNHIVAIESRISALNDLFVQLSSIGKIQETESLSARFNSELNYANSQQIQAQQVMNAAQMQLAVMENNQRQWMYQDEQNGIKAACGSARSSASYLIIPTCK